MITNLIVLIGAIAITVVGYKVYARYLALRDEQKAKELLELARARKQTEWNKLNNYKDVTQKNRRMNYEGDSYFQHNERKAS